MAGLIGSHGSRMAGRSLLVLVLLLAPAIGVCALQHDQSGMAGDDSLPPALCLAMVAASVSVVLLARPLQTGWAEPYRLRSLPTPCIHVLLPPPKTAPLA